MDITKVKEGWFITPRHTIYELWKPKRIIYKKGVKYKILNVFKTKNFIRESIFMITQCESSASILNRYALEFFIEDSEKINKKFKFISLHKERMRKIKSLQK